MNKDYIFSKINSVINLTRKRLNSTSELIDYQAILGVLQDLKLKLSNSELETDVFIDVKQLANIAIHVVQNYDRECMLAIGEVTHAVKVYYCKVSKNVSNNLKDFSLENISTSIHKLEILSSEKIKTNPYSEIIEKLRELRALLLEDKWPEPNFPEVHQLTQLIDEHGAELNQDIIEPAEKAVDYFNRYYDYLDPSYRQEN